MCADAEVFEGGGGSSLSGMKRDNAPRMLEVFSKQIQSRCWSEQLRQQLVKPALLCG